MTASSRPWRPAPPQPCGLLDAWKDIAIMDAAAHNVGRTVPLDLTPPA